ncbi:MAG TPA: ATPase, T2SS/T4P/T4SS family [Pilimelia sp.]|nr:ATPase, T2SS/T4P/T4SS family [Pilimelia sp.]
MAVVDADEVAVVRTVRRQVAAALTDASRAHDTTGGGRLSDEERTALTRRLITQVLDAHAQQQMTAGRSPLHPQVESRVARIVADTLLGAGGLQRWLDAEDVEDVTVNGCDVVHVRYADGTVARVPAVADSDAELVDLVRLLAARSGEEERRFDRAAPTLNLQLPDGSRLNAVMAVTKRPMISIRRHRYMKVTLDDLMRLGAIDVCVRELCAAAVRAKLNLIVAGRTGAGKTTFIRALASAIAADERLVTVEDTFELGLDLDPAHPNVVATQTREPNVEGQGAVDMAALFRNALRMVPDRVIVGEVRGPETVVMLHAMSQGNDGSLSTIHASSSAGVFRKLAMYAAGCPERWDAAATNMYIAEGVDLVVQLHREEDTNRRYVTSVREVVDADGAQVVSNEILRPGPDGRAVPGAPISGPTVQRLVAHGFDPDLLRRPHGWWNS